jgi:uncharacterized membrane protein YhaH (DUF805 family)
MGFGEATRALFVNWLDFRGRASRSEFWYALLFIALAGFACGIVDGVAQTGLFSLALNLILFLPGLSLQIRRLHDGGHSGWWLAATPALVAVVVGAFVAGGEILGFATLAAAGLVGLGISLAIIIWYCDRGTDGPNEYGPDPRGRRAAPAPRYA